MEGSAGTLACVVEKIGPLVVGFSGGADSALLAFVANDVLGPEDALCATAVSPSLSPEELVACGELAERWGLSWRPVETNELSDPRYVSNGQDRCYYCKSALMDALGPLAAERRATVALGVNLDDLSDHRPGQVAASSRGAVFPLVEAGLTKADVREISRSLSLVTADKPAQACLASRVPYGTPVTLGVLEEVARAESGLRRLGFFDLRVRHYGELARIEVPLDMLTALLEQRDAVVSAVKEAGYRYVTVDLEGLRSGNLNPVG